MKQILTILILIFSLGVQAQSLKGITLGEKHRKEKTIETSVAGYKGMLGYERTKNKIVSRVYFIFDAKCFNKSDLPDLINKVENRYNISFDSLEENGEITYITSKDDILYSIYYGSTAFVLDIFSKKAAIEKEELRANDF